MLNEDLTNFLAHLTTEPGVYRMFDASDQVLYVGKASNLKKRVSSYFTKQITSPKTASLVQQIVRIEVSVTRSETEALLLESRLIKSLRPKYNVLMRDDKSYPFIRLSTQHPFPSVGVIRSKTKPKQGDFFGPYPSVVAVRETVNLIQKVFKIRNCSDPDFQSRSRPCLQYQIKRCTAPCVGYISASDYARSVNDAKRFLKGKSQQLLNEMADRMAESVARCAFEEAALLRDQMKQIRLIQEQQGMVQTAGDADVIAIHAQPGFACVICVSVREGDVLACHRFFPTMPKEAFNEDAASLWQAVFQAFVMHYYLDMPDRIPKYILTTHSLANQVELEALLTQERGRVCRIQINPRGVKARWVDFAVNNLQQAVSESQTSSQLMKDRYQALNQLLQRNTPIRHMICFDISHTQGEQTVASCVVFDESGPCKRAYRHYHITGITPGDDYAAMAQALTRHFKPGRHLLPDVLVMDGGKGQVHVAERVLAELNIQGIVLLGIAKGPDRKAGWERLIFADGRSEQTVPSDSKALHLLQYLRDEAHRFAITAHRKKRKKSSFESSLERIEGIGVKRHQALLRRFGGLRELARASIDELEKVDGISRALAERIYHHFR